MWRLRHGSRCIELLLDGTMVRVRGSDLLRGSDVDATCRSGLLLRHFGFSKQNLKATI